MDGREEEAWGEWDRGRMILTGLRGVLDSMLFLLLLSWCVLEGVGSRRLL